MQALRLQNVILRGKARVITTLPVRVYSNFSAGSPNGNVTNFTIPSKTPHDNTQQEFDLDPKNIAETLQHDPNLENFYDTETLHSVDQVLHPKPDMHDPFDLSNIPILTKDSAEISSEILNEPYVRSSGVHGEPTTMSTEDFIKMMAQENTNSPDQLFLSDTEDTRMDIPSSDEYMVDMIKNQGFKESIKSATVKGPPAQKTSHNLLADFLNIGDIPSYDQIPHHVSLKHMAGTDLPLVVISKLTDPRLNLSIEKYIYEHFPDPKDPINRFCKRLFLYKNSNCIVLGKNQNIFREVNLRLASTYSIPILRRFSGGGTVVHDLGNFNFSFMCLKNDFSRTSFTTDLIENWNETHPAPEKQLTVNDKGDMVRQIDLKKVSGSAFQLSRGKALHHGTMLLNSDLKTLGRLLKLHPTRSSNIIDKATNSIPSPVTNTEIDHDTFVQITAQTFLQKFGLPTNLSKKMTSYDNIHVLKTGNIETQVLKIDDLTELPEEVQETYRQLKSWDWIFGKSPKFTTNFTLDNENIKLKISVDKGCITEMEYDLVYETDARLDDLIDALKSPNVKVRFASFSVQKYIKDTALAKEFAWHIDQCLNYDNIGIIKD